MTWRPNSGQRETFERNALTLVVFELRFNPVLLITKGTHVPEFQDAVRAKFPGFQTQEATTIALAPQKRGEGKSPFTMTRDRNFRFLSADGETTINFTSRQLTVECRRYKTREELFPDIDLAVGALRKNYAPIEVIRVGLRYHNVISAAALTKDLGRDVSEREIFAEEFLRLPANLADMVGTMLTTEVRSPVPPPGIGSMALRYGVTPSPDGPMCKIDMDRFIEGVSLQLEDLGSLLVQFSNDMATLFRAASGPAWREWMKPKGGA
jgi:uncharacterized protein (TIGR04255 family)